MTFQIVWFWNKTWLNIITFWCSWKNQVFRKSSKWYAFLNNLNKLIIWYTSRLTLPKIPFKPLTMIIQYYLFFYSQLTSRGTLSKSQIFPLLQVSLIWFILFPLIGATWITLGQKFQDNPNLTKALSSDKNFLSLRQHEPLWAQKTQTVQIWLKPFFWQDQFEPHLIPKNPVKTVHIVAIHQITSPHNQGS